MNSSISHPATNTPYREWERDEAGNKIALRIDRYFERGPIAVRWPERPPTSYAWQSTYLHAPIADWVRWVLDAGFTIRGLHEPEPTAEALALHPHLEDASRVPYFMIFDLERPQHG
jgi:hypothetical protein